MTRRPAKRGTKSLGEIFFVPTLIGIVSMVGLIAALVGDGVWDAVSWASLGIPVIVTVWMVWGPRGSLQRG
ncbi:hypothetical protein A7A08_00450 [Methyloligella halotolerans]|uniref:Uncharacterized protein n=1 Tax=Methyloligella halotolerans TaxID=1177755 RepID=A0A1E2S2R6_9HYPH|nr:hypothetical protein [Methyloligella halotolerans]ODA68619.1 hypothetical protein A7A08_00450 [Methyloligella halotolerans]